MILNPEVDIPFMVEQFISGYALYTSVTTCFHFTNISYASQLFLKGFYYLLCLYIFYCFSLIEHDMSNFQNIFVKTIKGVFVYKIKTNVTFLFCAIILRKWNWFVLFLKIKLSSKFQKVCIKIKKFSLFLKLYSTVIMFYFSQEEVPQSFQNLPWKLRNFSLFRKIKTFPFATQIKF